MLFFPQAQEPEEPEPVLRNQNSFIHSFIVLTEHLLQARLRPRCWGDHDRGHCLLFSSARCLSHGS